MDINIVDVNSFGLNRGIYSVATGNVLPDATCNALIAAGDAVLINYSFDNKARFTPDGKSLVDPNDPTKTIPLGGGGSSLSKNLEPKAYVTSRVSNFDYGVVVGSNYSGNPNIAFGGYKRSKVIIRNPVGNAGDLSVIYQPIINNISGVNSPTPVATLTPGNELVDYNSCGQWRVRSTLETAPTGLIVNVEIEEFI